MKRTLPAICITCCLLFGLSACGGASTPSAERMDHASFYDPETDILLSIGMDADHIQGDWQYDKDGATLTQFFDAAGNEVEPTDPNATIVRFITAVDGTVSLLSIMNADDYKPEEARSSGEPASGFFASTLGATQEQQDQLEWYLLQAGVVPAEISASTHPWTETMDPNWRAYDLVSATGDLYLLILRGGDLSFAAILDSDNELRAGMVDNGVLPAYFK